MTASRLPAPAGRRLDRSQLLRFEFNGRTLSGYAGDTLASALLANGDTARGPQLQAAPPPGIFLLRRGRAPPGWLIWAAARGRTPNLRATLLDLCPGLAASSVNCWPSVGFDVGAVNNRLAALLPAGFYYKTSNGRAGMCSSRRSAAWRGWAGPPRSAIRIATRKSRRGPRCWVIGGGIAGLSAAVAAAEAGADTLLVTGGAALGGALGMARRRPRRRTHRATPGAAACACSCATLAFGIYDHNLVCARETLQAAAPPESGGGVLRERLWKIRARSIIAAAGAFERPMIFPNNDRPGSDAGRRGGQICACLRRRLRPTRGDRGQQRLRLPDRRIAARRRSECDRAGGSPAARRHRRRDRAGSHLRRRRHRARRRRTRRAQLHRDFHRLGRRASAAAGVRSDPERGRPRARGAPAFPGGAENCDGSRSRPCSCPRARRPGCGAPAPAPACSTGTRRSITPRTRGGAGRRACGAGGGGRRRRAIAGGDPPARSVRQAVRGSAERCGDGRHRTGRAGELSIGRAPEAPPPAWAPIRARPAMSTRWY